MLSGKRAHRPVDPYSNYRINNWNLTMAIQKVSSILLHRLIKNKGTSLNFNAPAWEEITIRLIKEIGKVYS